MQKYVKLLICNVDASTIQYCSRVISDKRLVNDLYIEIYEVIQVYKYSRQYPMPISIVCMSGSEIL